MSQVWSCGGGTQSAAIAALIVKGDIPKPDIAVIADTGREKGSTWEYLDHIPLDIHRIPKAEFATCDLWSTNGEHLLIPAFTNQSGEVSKLPNYCSNEWKTRVIDRWLKMRGIREYRRWLGFSLDEPKRWLKYENSPEVWLPLVHGKPMRRIDCVSLVRSMGWPAPPRSACWMCPHMGNREWKEIRRNRPEEFAQACLLDEEIREKDPFAYLHKSCKPLSVVDFSDNQIEFQSCDSGECFI